MKYIGILLMLGSSAALAYELVKREEQKLECTRSLLALLIFTRDCIGTFGMSSREILGRCDAAMLYGCGYPEECEIPHSFEDMSVACFIPDAESRSAFSEFAAEFGRGYREREVERAEQCISRLQVRAVALGERLRDKKRMIVCLCISSALVLVILLL